MFEVALVFVYRLALKLVRPYRYHLAHAHAQTERTTVLIEYALWTRSRRLI